MIKEIEKLATKMRNALEALACEIEYCSVPPCWHIFPTACCGDTCHILAAYLAENGFVGFQYICGYFKGTNATHAWLERDGLIVDITLDQFQNRIKEALPSVFASKETSIYNKYFKRREAPSAMPETLSPAEQVIKNRVIPFLPAL